LGTPGAPRLGRDLTLVQYCPGKEEAPDSSFSALLGTPGYPKPQKGPKKLVKAFKAFDSSFLGFWVRRRTPRLPKKLGHDLPSKSAEMTTLSYPISAEFI